MTATDEALLARLNGECEPLGRSLSMVDTKDLRAFIADYRLKCELLRRASPPPSQDAVVEYTIKVDRAGNITNDTQCFNSSFADVYRAFHSIRDEVDRQIAERRICPYNPINPQPPEFSDTPAPASSQDATIKALVEALAAARPYIQGVYNQLAFTNSQHVPTTVLTLIDDALALVRKGTP